MPQMICDNCSTSEDISNCNMREDSRIYMAQIARVRSDGLDIFPLVCFDCGMVTEFAFDPTNSSGNAIEGIEFFPSFELDDGLKEKILNHASDNHHLHAFVKITNINGSNKESPEEQSSNVKPWYKIW